MDEILLVLVLVALVEAATEMSQDDFGVSIKEHKMTFTIVLIQDWWDWKVFIF